MIRGITEKYPGIDVFWDEMKRTPQNPAYHGEGDVFAHTVAVVEKITESPEYVSLSEEDREIMLLAAALHDVGKIKTTKTDDDANIVSPHHARIGAQIAREFLYRIGFCGDEKKMLFREAVCALIRYHGIPVHIAEKEDAVMRLAKFAESPATAEKLCLLSKADIDGRIAPDKEKLSEQVELCKMIAEDNGITASPMKFASSVTKRAWFSGRNVCPDYPIYDDTWGEVVLMSGIAGVGKDTWISENLGIPVISLDDIRKELRILPTENQLPIVHEARERAKVLLRKKQPFVWNATNLTQRIRSNQIELFESYGASVRIVYLEKDWETTNIRNKNRADEVPASVLDKMLSILEPPMPWEARKVEWI